MIPQYTKPQDTIALLLERVQQGIARRSNPVVIAPQYLLSRRGSETLPTVAWASSPPTTMALSYDNAGTTTVLPSTYVTDIADVTLWADNVLLGLDTSNSGRAWSTVVSTDSTRLRAAVVISDTAGSSRSEYIARNIAVGDILICSDTYGSGPIRRKITSLVGVVVPAASADVAAGTYNAAATSVGITAATGIVSAVSLHGANSWSAFYTGAKVGSESGDVFNLVFTSVNGTALNSTAVVTATKASTGEVIVGAAVCTTASSAPAAAQWKVTIVDTNAANTLVATVTLTSAHIDLVNGDVAVLTVKTAYVLADYTSPTWTKPVVTAYSGLTDTRVVIEVVRGGRASANEHVFRVSDTKGRGPAASYMYDNMTGRTITYLGLPIILPAKAYRATDVFSFDITALGASTTVFDGVVLDGPAYDTGLNPSGLSVFGELCENYSGQIQESWCSTFALASNVLTFGTVTFVDGLLPLSAIAGYGTISAGFRSIVPVPPSESWVTIYNSSEILSQLGPVDPDNPIAYGVYRAIGGTQGYPVYALRTGGTEDTDFSTALIKISNTDMVYALNIGGTQSTTVFTLLKDHCESQSVPTKKNFRRVYLGVDSPETFLRVGPNSSGVTAKAKITSYAGANLLLTFSTSNTDAEVDLVTAGVRPGDAVKINSVEHVIDSLITPVGGAHTTQALLVQESPPISAVVSNTSTEIWAAATAENQIDYMVAVAKSLGSRRAIVVWCEGGTTLVNGVVTAISSEYIAAEIAGLRCILPPQEGTTTYELTTVTSAPAMYTRYTEDQLNRAAANGVMVVVQEYPDGPVFIRHQLTTDTSNGLLAWEDSVGVNLDDQGFQVKDEFVGYRGRKNVTERTRKEITDRLFQLVFGMTQSQVTEEVGPQITGFTDEDGVANKVTVKFHPIFKDRFITFYRPGMPVPLNGIDHTIFGEVQDVI